VSRVVRVVFARSVATATSPTARCSGDGDSAGRHPDDPRLGETHKHEIQPRISTKRSETLILPE